MTTTLHRTHIAQSIFLFLAAASAARASGQDATTSQDATMPVVTVTGAAADDTGYLAKRSSTATKMDIPLLETPQSVTIVTADQIRDQASPNLQEVLRYAAGVRNELYGVDNRGDYVSLRGSSDLTTLLDGLRLPLSGSWGIVRTEPYAYDRIEVLRGPSSIIAGENDPGGVVNLVSKRPQAERAHEAGIRLGNDNLRELHGDFTGPLTADGSLLYRLVVVGKDSDTQIRHADEKRELFAPSLTWKPNATDSVTVYAEYQHDRSKNTNAFLGLEGTLYAAPNGPIPTDLFIGEPAWDRYGGTRKRAGYALDVALGPDWQLRHNLRHDRVTGLMKSMYAAWWDGFVDATGASDPTGQYMNRIAYVNRDSTRTTSGDLTLQGKVRTGAVRHTLMVGIDGTAHDAAGQSSELAASPLNVYAPVYGVDPDPGEIDAPWSETRIRRIGVLAQDQMKFNDALSVRVGARRDRVRNSTVGGDVKKDAATSINVGVVYQARPGLAPYASYSESFVPVSGTDAAGRSFKPKRGEQYEAGVKWEPVGLPVQATASVYTLKEKNRLANDPANPNFSIQLGEARVKGIEAEVKADVAAWNLLASYSYTRARASAGSYGGDLDASWQIEGIPEHGGSVWAIHDFGRMGIAGLKAGGGLRYVGRNGDGTGKVTVPSVTLGDLMVSYDMRAWRFALNVNNLADKDYIATCLSRGDCWFGQRRKVVLSADYRW
ncbi:TonB-dependent siderophore receptor [Pseudoduganella lutea]|uniref:TonB-dependent siderophore receptor n=1 Tax=Pseudoduganella lutea TaxID=321985 RepID=A0A4P6L336_9BURK|nr:TonB-dependent siderophore receptor [Pseudoduganella lutea]QBE65857.1 TonB-dependent siderophore receptor [Pseudoduganella lutea]